MRSLYGARCHRVASRRAVLRCERSAPSRALLGRGAGLGDRRRDPDEIVSCRRTARDSRSCSTRSRSRRPGKNRLHLDLTTTSIDDQQESVARLVELGARPSTSVSAPTTVMSCSPTPKATSSASSSRRTTSSPAADVSDRSRATGTPEVGYFWSAALGWPLVWDQDEETAIRAPDGTGPFITWGPPAGPEAREEPAPSRHRAARRRRPAGGGRPPRRARSDPDRHRPRRCDLGRDGRSRRQRVLCVDASLEQRRITALYRSAATGSAKL